MFTNMKAIKNRSKASHNLQLLRILASSSENICLLTITAQEMKNKSHCLFRDRKAMSDADSKFSREINY